MNRMIRGALGSKPDDLQLSATREDRTKRSRLMASYGEIDNNEFEKALYDEVYDYKDDLKVPGQWYPGRFFLFSIRTS